jgi:hypothetical protein
LTKASQARLIVADFSAAVTLLLSALYIARFYDPALPSLATFTGGGGSALLAIFFSIVAFVLSLRIKSSAIAGMLIVAGVMMQIPPLQAIAEAGKVLVPGPILGVVSFAPILLLGAVKAIGVRTKVIKQRTASGAYVVALTMIFGRGRPPDIERGHHDGPARPSLGGRRSGRDTRPNLRRDIVRDNIGARGREGGGLVSVTATSTAAGGGATVTSTAPGSAAGTGVDTTLY